MLKLKRKLKRLKMSGTANRYDGVALTLDTASPATWLSKNLQVSVGFNLGVRNCAPSIECTILGSVLAACVVKSLAVFAGRFAMNQKKTPPDFSDGACMYVQFEPVA